MVIDRNEAIVKMKKKKKLLPRIVYVAIHTLFMMFRAMAHCLLWTIVLICWQDTENRTQKQSEKWNYNLDPILSAVL